MGLSLTKLFSILRLKELGLPLIKYPPIKIPPFIKLQLFITFDKPSISRKLKLKLLSLITLDGPTRVPGENSKILSLITLSLIFWK